MDLVLHIGAHRTGSTTVERTITGTIAAKPDCGVALWAPRRLRDIEGFQAVTRRLDGNAEPVDKDAAVALDGLASRLARDAAQERSRGVKTLILSEENMMGGMRNNFRTGTFYGDVGRRLAGFDSVLPASPRRVALGVREYGAVWTSAYHYLPQSGHTPPPAALVREAMMDSPRGWPDVVADVQKLWPDAEVVIWQQERLNNRLSEICGRISGLPHDLFSAPKERINARVEPEQQDDLFSPEDRKHLRQRYNRHMAQLRDQGDVVWADHRLREVQS